MCLTKESAHVVRFSPHIFQYKNNGYIAGLFSLALFFSFFFFSLSPLRTIFGLIVRKISVKLFKLVIQVLNFVYLILLR